MAGGNPYREAFRKGLVPDRRAGPGASAWLRALRRLRGLLRRPLRLEWRGRQLHVVLVERRRPPRAPARPSAAEVRSALRERLRPLGRDHVRAYLRHLLVVYRELGHEGWRSVGSLPAEVLRKALLQAELLTSGESTPTLDHLVDRLRVLKTAVQQRDLNRRLLAGGDTGEIEVSDATLEDFDETERGWFDTMPAPSRPSDQASTS